MQTLQRTLAVVIVPAIACLGAACERTDTPTQPPRSPSFSHSGPHSGTYTVWSLNEQVGLDPAETLADLSNQSGHLASGPVMITGMGVVFLAGNQSPGILYWNPVANAFSYYRFQVARSLQPGIDLDRRAIPSTGLHGSFGGGNVWATVFGGGRPPAWVQFRGAGNIRRYELGSVSSALGIRVNPANGKVYLANFDGQLVELDPATNAVRTWPTGNRPCFLELDALGRVYATAVARAGFPDQIIRLDPLTNVITRWTIPGGGLQGGVSAGTFNYITEDAEGNFWFSETASGEYGRLNPVTNVIEEFTKPGVVVPHGVATSGAGPTLQMYGMEAATPGSTDVLTRAAATQLVTVVPPTVSTVLPAPIPATFEDLVSPRTDVVITPTTATVTSSNGSGIDRFPQPPGVFMPTSLTGVVLPNTIFGSVLGSDDVEQFVSTVIVAPPPPPPVGGPATLVLDPPAATNPVDTRHCVTATVRDEFGNPVPNVEVRFTVMGSVNTSGSATTDANGEATFCYDGPPLPGADQIHAFADTDQDETQDAGEPFGEATKTWVLPVTTPLCEIKITQGGSIIAQNGDKATFGGNAKSNEAGDTQGQENYQDHGPAQPMHVHSINVLAIVCDTPGTEASVYGRATIDGQGDYFYRIKVRDLEEPGRGNDTYWILLSNGYNSGDKVLEGGNVQIHKG